MESTKADDSPVYQLKVTLKGSKPPIWRRIQVRGNTTLAKLHGIIQTAMGWTDSHLHQFTIDGVSYGTPDPDGELELKSERRVKLGQLVARGKARFRYEYDFGDSWDHEIEVEQILPPEPGVRYPVCLAGKLACPPEDCGGIWGYVEFLEAIGNPEHEEHEAMLEWVGGAFAPEAFDLVAVNRLLQQR